MSLVEAFLLVSAVAYFWGMVLPEAATNFGLDGEYGRRLERVCLFLFGVALILVVYPIGPNWAFIWVYRFALGVLYVGATLCSYLGYVRWKPVWISEEAFEVCVPMQMVMFAWDLAISTCIFSLLLR